ncbi:MAG TPA: autotransporter-associated beta strand repeat-containing protein, partial [Xanthobacteraceae bacterium]|nr:autotransporter-associated beta strand repeat-containing protein [Xanthobacteraceae bacterium]
MTLDNTVANTTVDSLITGTGGVIKTGANTITLSASNTYTGGTTITQGTLAVSSDANLGDAAGALTLSGGTLQATGTFTSNRTVTITGASTIDVTGANNLTLTNLTGGSFTKTNTGTLTLSGTNYGGDVTIAAGGGTLSLAGNALTAAANITTLGSVIDYADGVNNPATITLNSNTTQLQVLAGAAATQSGDISEIGGPRPLEKIGDGTLTLSGNNSYTGLTTITGGTLVAANANALGTTAGGTVVANGANLTIANVAIGAEAVTLNGGNALT